jgi:hypothetical protein
LFLAARPGHLLWTDDSRLAGFAKNEHGVKSAWTQVLLQWAAQRGHISEQKFFASTAKLIGYGYSFTSPSLPALIAAAEISDWDKARWPLSRALVRPARNRLNSTARCRFVDGPVLGENLPREHPRRATKGAHVGAYGPDRQAIRWHSDGASDQESCAVGIWC